ncbi:helix-turn-helix domain-containing protein [Brevibacillus agri]|uniref:helix-turn-helix domain-containing protein n=1 Tax=Brevibacillus agri TaxID=51101 RepID=UPI002E1FE3FE|nr:helix-turn-helix domain-containing protein [Brevibacillus agri]MED1654456.1 helix-turn-helix domain-containing protein [Brevibacillus agri]MED1688139.1 helix-turn-helix domain-containing protein [Brevibacillus agri]MED1691131.1 helix-turn-helix domain-containing protein [Brevibacillus agri]MED1699367.1 helix-turn-helix domain-containing protein [Brevibacillus agri]
MSMTLGSRIKQVRRLRGYTQKYMADQLNMTEANFSSYERDKSIPPSEKLNQISTILKVSTDYLLGKTDDMTIQDPYSLTAKEEKDIAVKLQKMMDELENDSSVAFMGEPLDEEDRELLRISLENTLRLSKQMAKKKFTPNKYRK